MASTPFDYLMIAYGLQHLIYMIMRLPIFCLCYTLTICCDSGRDFPESHMFQNLIISYDFIEYEEGHLGESVNRGPMGIQEI